MHVRCLTGLWPFSDWLNIHRAKMCFWMKCIQKQTLHWTINQDIRSLQFLNQRSKKKKKSRKIISITLLVLLNTLYWWIIFLFFCPHIQMQSHKTFVSARCMIHSLKWKNVSTCSADLYCIFTSFLQSHGGASSALKPMGA